MQVLRQVEQLFLGPVQEVGDASLTEHLQAAGADALPARRAPQVRGEREFLFMVQVDDVFVRACGNGTHRVHHRDLVHLVGAENGVPAFRLIVVQDRQQRFARQLVRRALRLARAF